MNNDLREAEALATDAIVAHVGQVIVEIQKGFDQRLLREIAQILQAI